MKTKLIICISIIAAVLLILLLCIPHSGQSDMLDQAMQQYMVKLKHELGDRLFAEKKLPSGGYLVIQREPADFGPTEPNRISLGFQQHTYRRTLTGYKAVSKYLDIMCVSEATPIFFKSGWDEPWNNPEAENMTICSFFTELKGYKGSDIVIYVSANRTDDDFYESSEWYKVIPSDSLSNKPLLIHDIDWEHNFPAWIFVVPKDKLDGTYELHYGEYVLTGNDILSGTWTPQDQSE